MILLGIDPLIDMARTVVNVGGNCLAVAAIDRWQSPGTGAEGPGPGPDPEQGSRLPVRPGPRRHFQRCPQEDHTVRNPRISASVLDVVGQTPLIALSRMTAGCRSRVLVKLESANPGLSVKDRPALQLLRDAERQGHLRPGMTVIERTSGNMGTGLALACLHLGYKLVVLMSAGNSVERRQIIQALGGKVILVPQVNGRPGQVTADDLKAVERETIRLMNELKAYRADQFHNPSSVRAHERGTGPEIWRQCRGQLDAFVSVAGSAGTFVGVSRYLKRRNPKVKCYAVEPTNAALLSGRRKKPGRHRLQGVGYMEIPPLWQAELADGFISVGDREATTTARLLGRKEGILAGTRPVPMLRPPCGWRGHPGGR